MKMSIRHASLISLFTLTLIRLGSAVATGMGANTVSNGEYRAKERRGEGENITKGNVPSSAPVGTPSSHVPTFASQLPTSSVADADSEVTKSPKPSLSMSDDTPKPTNVPTSQTTLKPTMSSTATQTEAPTSTNVPTVATQTPTPTTVQATPSPTTATRTKEPLSASPIFSTEAPSSSPTSSSSMATPTDVPTSNPTSTRMPTPTPITSMPTSLRSKAPSSVLTHHSTVTQTTSPSTGPTYGPTIVILQTDVEGDNRIDPPGDSKPPKKEDSKDRASDDGDSLESFLYSPGCDAIARGEIYAGGIPVQFNFLYQLVYDATKNFTEIVQSLEATMQDYLAKALIFCRGSTEYFAVDGIHVELSPQPLDACGGGQLFQEAECAVLDGSTTLYLSRKEKTSDLEAKQYALRALKKGMEEGSDFLDEREGIFDVSFKGGVGIETTDTSLGIVPAASARIIDPPISEGNNQLSGLGVFLVFFAVLASVILLLSIGKRRARKRSKTLKDVAQVQEGDISEEKSENEEEAIESKPSVVKSITEAFVASKSVFGLEAAQSANDDDSDDDDDEGDDGNGDGIKSMMDDEAGLNTHSIKIHQYCTSPTCTICRSWKKPMFTDLKYNVDKQQEEALRPEDVACPRGIATAISMDYSKGNCYLCTA